MRYSLSLRLTSLVRLALPCHSGASRGLHTMLCTWHTLGSTSGVQNATKVRTATAPRDGGLHP